MALGCWYLPQKKSVGELQRVGLIKGMAVSDFFFCSGVSVLDY